MNTSLAVPHWRLGILLLVLASMTGCGVVKTLYASSDKFDNPVEDDAGPVVREDEYVKEAANRFGLMAWFAEAAYRRDLHEDVRQIKACDYLSDGKSFRNDMPDAGSGNGHWERWIPERDDVPSCVSEGGLFYETYVYKNKDARIDQAVIAFRGTENEKGQFYRDWSTNFSNFFGFEPGQYRLARTRLPIVVRHLKELNPNVEIYAVGHSLGGGLAQQTGYQFNEVLEVYTFNTSPVTNWTHLRLNSCPNGLGPAPITETDTGQNNCVANDYPTIYRVYHTGEVLSKLRNLSTTFTTSRYGRYDLGFQFKPKSNFRGHSMQILACAFADIIAHDETVKEEANHHYPRSYIEHHMLTCGACRDYQNAMYPREDEGQEGAGDSGDDACREANGST